MNGEDLVYDWQFNVVNDCGDEWTFNWDYAEGGTSNPTPRDHYATCWVVTHEDIPIAAMKRFFIQEAPKTSKLKLQRDQEGDYQLTLIDKQTKAILMTGSMRDRGTDDEDPNVGNYAMFQSNTERGTSLVNALVQGAQIHGMLAFIPHNRIERRLDDGYRVVSITGQGGPDEDNEPKGLATRFTLFHENEEVARCHMTYTDCTWDPSMGPTIEMIAVKQSRRGEGLSIVLWYWVRRFIEDHFTIECLHTDAPLKHVMIKATQMGQNEIDIRMGNDGSMHPMGFKQFIYDYCAFSVREQKGAAASLFRCRRPKDEEAVLYIPLLEKDGSSRHRNAPPKPGNAILHRKCGKRMCHWCSTVQKKVFLCARCSVASYCKKECQTNDWKRHKQWCNKTSEQVREKLIERGNMTQNSDGSCSLVMNGPGRTFGVGGHNIGY
jgi:hypothetical protein